MLSHGVDGHVFGDGRLDDLLEVVLGMPAKLTGVAVVRERHHRILYKSCLIYYDLIKSILFFRLM